MLSGGDSELGFLIGFLLAVAIALATSPAARDDWYELAGAAICGTGDAIYRLMDNMTDFYTKAAVFIADTYRGGSTFDEAAYARD